MRHCWLIARLLIGMVLGSRSSEAQYTADNQTNIISGVTSNWSGDYLVGSNTFADTLLIQSSGVLSNGAAFLGYEAGSSNNSVLVTGVGSVWSNRFSLYVGYSAPGNSLTISNGGRVINIAGHPPGSGWVGYNSSSSNNSILVADTNSVWSCNGMIIGYSGPGNSLVISNGGGVLPSGNAYLGYGVSSSNNTAVITSPGSFWNSPGDLTIGLEGAGNSLLIRDGGQVTNASCYIGWYSSSINNTVLVIGAGSTWTNRSNLFLGYSGADNSIVISNGGLVTAGGSLLGYQFGADNNSVIVTGSGSGWNAGNQLTIGFNSSGNTLLISDGGWVTNASTYIGQQNVGSSNNKVLVTGSGSVWSNSSDLYIGYFGRFGNSLVISNGGRVINRHGYISYQGLSSDNGVFVAGADSVWSNTGDVCVGYSGASSTLVISNDARVISSGGYVGYSSQSSNNNVRIVSGSIWQNSALIIGYQGSSNSIMIDGGSVSTTNVLVGAASTVCDNLLQLDCGSVIVTNASTNAVLEVRRGKFILNGGTLQVDRFVMTNACAQFVRMGGTLIYGTAVLDPNRDDDGDGIPNGWEQSHSLDPLDAADATVDSDGDGFTNLQEYLAGTELTNNASAFRITNIAQESDSLRITWTMGSGKTNALQSAAGASYTTNFANLFIVTNTVGSVTNYLDVGGATNLPARYYRVRLVP